MVAQRYNRDLTSALSVTPRIRPVLDPEFVPASLWNRAYRARVAEAGGSPLSLALERADGAVSVFRTAVLPHGGENIARNLRYIERLLKFLLWQKGGYRVSVAGPAWAAAHLRAAFSPGGDRAFDHAFMGERVYRCPMVIEGVDEVPQERENAAPLGRHLDGCRIGLDLGASSRKCAAVVEGRVVFNEAVPWDPAAQADPQYHSDGIEDSLRRAAARLPRVDAIGASAAGVYVDNEVRVASLFRAVPLNLFETRIRPLFFNLRKAWGGIPFEVANDGEVTALAGSMALGDAAVLGIAMGSSMAAGFVTPEGTITTWLNELAFAPVDYREDAPVDEWSGDRGAGVQYFSQQAVARLLAPAGIDLPLDTPCPTKLERVRELMAEGDARARRIYETIGAYLGYAVAHYADFYQFRNVLALGGVMAGPGGEVILSVAAEVLRLEFPELAARIRFHVSDEKEKRHGQAIAAASLPAIAK